jgi:hypothetical protein
LLSATLLLFFPPYQSKNHADKQFAQSTMLMQGLCCIRDVEGGLRFLRRAALQDEPNSMLQYAQVLDDGVLLQRSSSAAAFFLNRAMAAVQEAADGSLDHLKVIRTSLSQPQTQTRFTRFVADQVSLPPVQAVARPESFSDFFQNLAAARPGAS